jgi:hypothetical protein
MSLDIWLTDDNDSDLWDGNITHNLGNMADSAGIYRVLWRPEELGLELAKDVQPYLEKGLIELARFPDRMKQFEASNGWGTYQDLVTFVMGYIAACQKHPDARVTVSR